MRNKLITFLAILCSFSSLFAQEALKSMEEDYYSLLSLPGLAESPTLGYRTLSDNIWNIYKNEAGEEAAHIWQGNNLGTTWNLWQNSSPAENWFLNGIKQSLSMKVYGPEWFNSFNTGAPYGQNDGALWQGRGYNTSLTAGIRFEAFGFEATFKPQLSFSQNLAFDLISPAYSGSAYAGKADTYGYFGVTYLDAPQRFGEDPFFTYDWGDTEIRWTWKSFTIGFGTQSIWLGPAKLNPIMHSNNAPTYPKVDVGLRKTSLYMPYFGWYLGDIEARTWVGKLTESDYFDNDDSNNETMLTAMSISFAPAILEGLVFTANRVFHNYWDFSNLSYLAELFFISLDNLKQIQNDENQIASVSFSYSLPDSSFRMYGEVGIDDYVQGKTGIIRYPFHTMVWTAGFEQSFELPADMLCRLSAEFTNMEMSQDFQFQWPYTFYAHGRIKQGYTNRGQWIGAGCGTGGNSQYLGFDVYSKKWNVKLFLQRTNTDNNYLYSKTIFSSALDSNGIRQLESQYFTKWRATLSFGIEGVYFVLPELKISAGMVYNLILNPIYENQWWGGDGRLDNYSFSLGLKYFI
ncbi:MAG: capsule assembly Wzi family protein [Treponemataceae bacterium]|nr:capsule assembly Wzi family protein [Treponemataceae bacterium]